MNIKYHYQHTSTTGHCQEERWSLAFNPMAFVLDPSYMTLFASALFGAAVHDGALSNNDICFLAPLLLYASDASWEGAILASVVFVLAAIDWRVKARKGSGERLSPGKPLSHYEDYPRGLITIYIGIVCWRLVSCNLLSQVSAIIIGTALIYRFRCPIDSVGCCVISGEQCATLRAIGRKSSLLPWSRSSIREAARFYLMRLRRECHVLDHDGKFDAVEFANMLNKLMCLVDRPPNGALIPWSRIFDNLILAADHYSTAPTEPTSLSLNAKKALDELREEKEEFARPPTEAIEWLRRLLFRLDRNVEEIGQLMNIHITEREYNRVFYDHPELSAWDVNFVNVVRSSQIGRRRA